MDCLGDFGPRVLSVQYTQDVCGCPPAHTGRPWPSVSKHRTSVAVCVCPTAHTGRLWLSISTYISTLVLGLSTVAHPVDCSGDFGPRGLSLQYTQDVRGCPSAHTGCLCVSVSSHRTSVAVRVCTCVSVSTHRTSMDVHHTLTLPVDCSGDFGPRGLSVQYTKDVFGCPPAHAGRLWLSVSKHRTSVAVRVCSCVSVNTHRTSVAVHQYIYKHAGPWTQHGGPSRGLFGTSVGVLQHTQDVRVCPSAHRGCPSLFGCVRVLSAHTGRPWLSISTHISTLVLGLSTLTLPVDCSGDFGPRGLSVQYTQDVYGCPQAHTESPWLSVSKHRTSVAVRVCSSAHIGHPWLSISTHISTLVLELSTKFLRLSTVAHPVDCSGDFGPRGLSNQYTQDVCGCPSAHTRCPFVSVSSHSTSVAVRVCSCKSVSKHRTSVAVHHTLTLPVDCSGDFGPRGLSVQYTQDVRGCLPAHTGSSWLSVSKHRTYVAVCVCLCVSVSTHRTSVAVHQYTYQHAGRWTQHGGPPRSLFGTSVGVRQHKQDVHVCLKAHTGRQWLYVCVRVCLSAHTGRPWLSISTHISTLVLGLSTLTLPVDCSGDFGQRWLSVQYIQEVIGCPPAHTRRLWLSVAVHKHTQDFRGCPCVSVSTHRMSVAVYQYTYSTLVLLVDCLGDFGPCGLSVQYTQDVCGCPLAHTGCLWLSVCRHRTFVAVRVRLCVSISTHRTSVAVHQYTYQHAGPWTQHAGPSRGLFGTSVGVRQHTQDICGFPWLAHIGRPQDVSGCPSAHTGRPCVSVSTHRMFVAVYVCPSAHTGRLWLSINTHISTLVPGLSTLAVPVDCLGDFGPRGLSVQYTQDVRGCPPTHTGRLLLSVSKHRTSVAVRVCSCVSVSTHKMYVAVHKYTYQHAGPWTQHGGPSLHTGRPWVSVSTNRTSVCVRQHTQDVCGCPCVSVCVRQHTQDIRGCPSVHISARWSLNSARWSLNSARRPFPWTLGDFGPRGLSVQDTQDVRGCPPAHTGHPWLSMASTHRTSVAVVCIRVYPCVSVSTDRTSVGVRQHTQDVPVCPSAHTGNLWLSVCVRQHTQDVCGCPSVHISARWSLDSARWPFPWTVWVIFAHVGCLFSTHRTSVGVRQHTQNVCGCPWLSVSKHRTSVAVRVCPSPHTRCPWLSVSTHRMSVAVCECPSPHTTVHHTLALPVDCLGDFGPRGLSVQYTQDVRGCPPAHTGRLWLSVSKHRTYVAVRVCPCVSVSTHKISVPVHKYTYQHAGPWTRHGGPSRGLFGTSVGVRQHTQDICVCPSPHTGRSWLSVCVRLCPSAHTGRPRLSISSHISTLVFGLSTLTLLVDCSVILAHMGCLFSTHGTSVGIRQHTQDVCGCPCVSVCVCQHTQDVRGCPSVHISARWSLDSARWPFPWTAWVILAHHKQDVRGCPCVTVSIDRTSVGVRQHTQDVRVCPSAHTGRPWLSVCVRQHTQDVCGCLWLSVSKHRTSVDVRVCLCVSVNTHWTSVAVHQYTYQHAGPWTQHGGPSRGLFGTLALAVDCLGDFDPRGLSVQYTQDVRGCPPAHTGHPWQSVASTHRTSVAVRVYPCLSDVRGCPSAHTGRPCVSVSTHRMYVAVCVCPSAHTGRLWLSISTHISTLVLGLSTLALPVDCLGDFCPRGLSVQYTQDVRGCLPAHTERLWLSVSKHRTSVAVRVCTSAHTRCSWLSISRRISTLVLGLSTVALPVDCLGDFGPRGLSVQYTQDVRGCPSEGT
ncbi:hypothetical protein IGI04_036398 [Brassica rapa subsp. trilocularis]|uniref:Uncharacterized protein n=1 Tax=Brassica rapa subsp. trilocularis TaxID=1813537 RepID=A0ABQ7LHE2_BRACM|nr:hypothetical protein IGI04_036398 [Brassica rapa subsp. trilocularis]